MPSLSVSFSASSKLDSTPSQTASPSAVFFFFSAFFVSAFFFSFFFVSVFFFFPVFFFFVFFF